MTAPTTPRPAPQAPPRRAWLLPAGLLALSVVPVAAGAARLAQLASGVVTPENQRFFDSPVPVVVHVPTVTVFAVLGAFQLVPALRSRRPAWHRRAGRVVAVCGLAAALSGLWMSVFSDLPAHDGEMLRGIRLVVGSAMVAALVLGVAAARRRDFRRHRAWMLRGYALGMGAGTQVLTVAPWALVAGDPSVTARAFLMGAGWAINLAVVEVVLRRRPA